MDRRKIVAAAGMTALLVAVPAGLFSTQQVGAGTWVVPGWPSTAGWPAAKARLWQQAEAEMAAARASHRGIPKSQVRPPAEQTNVPPVEGAVVAQQGPWPASGFLGRNFWQGPAGSAWVLVFAGATRNPVGLAVAQGALRLLSYPSTRTIGTFLAPVGTDPLTVVAVNGNVLLLKTDSGKRLTFDLLTHQYTMR